MIGDLRIVWAHFRRFFHCLFRLHRPVDRIFVFDSKKLGKDQEVLASVECECGKNFWRLKL